MALADTASLAVKLTLDDRQFTGPLKRVQSRLGTFNKSFGQVGGGVGKLATGFGRVFATGALAGAGALAAATKTALDFQDAMAGVSKTVDGTPDQIAAIGQQLLDLSTAIPVSATDLANIAQELGALGVPRDDIANTARVVAELAAATVGLSPEAAAEAFGKLGNVLQVHGPDVERFGSSLVALGNAGASSEGDIITVATRFGAAGSQAKLSAAEVLGFSSAIASLGVEPEAAGSSLSRLFNNVTKYIGTGDKKIKSFAKVAGVSVKEFSNLFAKDAAGAMELFLEKLGGLDRFAASKALKDAGITNVRDINAVLLLSQNYDILKQQLDLSTDAWRENTELSDTAAKRFGSVQAKLTVFWNTIKRAAIVMANEFLPALGRSIDRLGALLKLPSTDNDLRNLGQDIAGFLDGINWNAVIDGAKSFFGLVRDLVSLISKVPPEIDAAVLAFAGLNKLSGGLIGQGVGDIVGGLGGAVARGVASKAPIVGSLFAQPVFVTNWPVGGFGGGMPGGASPGAAAGGGGGLLAVFSGAALLAGTTAALSVLNSAQGQTIGQIRANSFGVLTPGQTSLQDSQLQQIIARQRATNGTSLPGDRTGPSVPQMTRDEAVRNAIETSRMAQTSGSARIAAANDRVRERVEATRNAQASGASRIAAATDRVRDRVESSRNAMVTAIHNNKASVVVNVKNNVSVSQLGRARITYGSYSTGHLAMAKSQM